MSLSVAASLSFSQLDGLLTDRESLPERSKEIRERLRGKGLPSGELRNTHTHTQISVRLVLYLYGVLVHKPIELKNYFIFSFYAVKVFIILAD